ncbi:MAG TPA: phosphotransferase [Burkholderiales bacterium]
MNAADSRLAALSEWVAATLGDSRCDIRPASADASFRRYFRVRDSRGRTLIAMDAPPEKEDCGPYVRIARALRALGLNVPEIHAQDLERGFLLISDLGDRLYLAALEPGSADALYGDALRALVRLQCARLADFAWLPPYDAPLLRREMELFREWYLGRHLGLALTPAQHAVLDAAFEALTANALAQPRVVVHRDYHSRNLLVTARDNPGILDFQDAVIGPATYDLVSLLRDCYVAWPRERVEAWVREYRALAAAAGIGVGGDAVEFQRWFDLMGVQRHLKAAGIFARLNHRDGKPGYLKDIPRTLGYVREVAAHHPELADLGALLADLPAVEARAAGNPA